MFYNVLTTSINNTHIKRKNSKTICGSETISSRIFGSAPNSPNTRCHWCNLVSLTSCGTVIGDHFMARTPSRATKPTKWSAPSQSRRARKCLRCSTKKLWRCEPKPAYCTLSNMKLPAAETDYWSGISWSLRSKNKIWNNANNWGNIICKQKNKRKKCSKQLTKYPFNQLTLIHIWQFSLFL
jgi:hypothetical protein